MGEAIEVRPVTGSIGAEVLGVDLSKPLSDGAFRRIHRAFLDHLALLFRDQDLPPARLTAFARRFGPLADQYFKPLDFETLDGHPEIAVVVKEADDRGINFGGSWHADVTCWERPILGNVLYFKGVPAAGGDTLFANQYLAYESLSKTMRGLVRGLTGVHSAIKTLVDGCYVERKGDAHAPHPGEGLGEGEMAHPAVRTHPETGRKALFVNRTYTIRFLGLTAEESRPLLEFLCEHAMRPEFTCRFRWEAGTVGIWDNRCALHNAVNDYHGRRRVMVPRLDGRRPPGLRARLHLNRLSKIWVAAHSAGQPSQSSRYSSMISSSRSRPKLGSCPPWTTVTGISRSRSIVRR